MAYNSKNLSYPGGYRQGLLEIEAHSSGSTVSATATVTIGGGYWEGWPQVQLRLYIDGDLVNSTAISSCSSNQVIEIDGSASCSDGSVEVTAEFYNPYRAAYILYSGSVDTYVSVSTRSSGSLSLNKTSAYMNESIVVTATAGRNNSITGITWSCNGQTGSLSSGTFRLDCFETAMANSRSATVTITATQRYFGNLTKTFTLMIPNDYVPDVTITDVIKVNPENEHLIAGQSSFQLVYDARSLPATSEATIASIRVKSYAYSPSSVTGTITFTHDAANSKFISSVLPSKSGISSYLLQIVLQVTDSRGVSSEKLIQLEKIFCYVPPLVTINSFYRCDSQGSQLPSGRYCHFNISIDSRSAAHLANIIVQKGETTPTTYNIKNQIVPLGQNKYEYDGVIGNNTLDVGSQYYMTLEYQSQEMYQAGDSAFTFRVLLPTMIMPLSLLDDGSMVATSFGEMAQHYSDVTSETVVNFAQNAVLRATHLDESIVVEAFELLNLRPYVQAQIQNILTNILGSLKIVAMTDVDYEDLEDKDPDTIYFVYEED